jgi:hypothetical protein
MSGVRNALVGIFASALLVTSQSYAGSNGKFTATYVGPANQWSVNGAGGLYCTAVTECSFIRDGIVPPGQSRIAARVTTLQDNVSVFVHVDVWFASACMPDPTMPDLFGEGDLPLPTAGTYVIHFMSEDLLPSGTTFSQKWTGTGFCVNSLAGQPTPAPADCDQP